MIKRTHHIGILVKNLDEAVQRYTGILGQKPRSVHEVPATKMKIAIFQVGETALEFLEVPPGSPVAAVMGNRGEGIVHLAFEVDDIAAELKKLAAAGVTLHDKEPRQGVVGKVAFVGPEGAHGVTIELVQLEKKGK